MNDLEKLAKLRGISVQALLEIDRNVRACGLYHTEADIARITDSTIQENIVSIRRYDYAAKRGAKLHKNSRD